MDDVDASGCGLGLVIPKFPQQIFGGEMLTKRSGFLKDMNKNASSEAPTNKPTFQHEKFGSVFFWHHFKAL